tara:strand:+ start:55 stop:501 length:447 start_codon:yes stop_codon:yes gene_type:complete
MASYNTKDEPVSETMLGRLLSMEGIGKTIPEGTTIFYKDRKTKEVKKIVKRVGGRATPRTEDARGDTGRVGDMKESDIKQKGNINAPRTFKVFEDGKSRKGTDLEFLRDRRKEMKIKTGKSKPDTVPPFRKSGGISIDYRKRKGGLFS